MIQITGVDALGCAASAAVLATFGLREMVALRLMAIVSNVLFVAYAHLAGLWPVLILHSLLLPLNALRLHEALRRRAASPERGGRPRVLRKGGLARLRR